MFDRVRTQFHKDRIQGEMFSSSQLKMLIYPLIIEQVLEVSVGIVDTVMVSHAGEAAMSGVSLVDMINNLLISIFGAVATGGAVVVSQYLGHQDRKMAGRAAQQLLVIITLVALATSALFLCFRVPLLKLLFGSIAPDVMKNAMAYFLISTFSYPFLAVYNASAATFRAMGNSKISMEVSFAINIFNAVGNLIFIFGLNMGAAGSAVSTLIARFLGAAILLYLLSKPKQEVTIHWRGLLEWDSGMIGRILHIGIPNGIENGLFQLGRVLVVSIIALFGTAQIAANAVANNLDSMGCIAGGAMNLAMITVVGHCMGAGKKEEAAYYTRQLWKITYIITLVINFCILMLLPFILKIYSLSGETYHYAFILVWIHDGCAMLLWPTAFTLSYALRAAGDVKFTMVTAIFSMCVFRILFSIILGIGLGWGAIGVWIAMIIDWIFRAGVFTWRFYSGKWKKYDVIG